MRIKAKYAGRCNGCGAGFPKGYTIEYRGRGETFHGGCAPTGHSRLDSEYMAGVQDANRYMESKRMFGEAFAEREDMERELRSGGDY